jgi:hypothetical protein
MAILVAWTTAALACGYLVLAHTGVTSVSRPRRRRWLALARHRGTAEPEHPAELACAAIPVVAACHAH